MQRFASFLVAATLSVATHGPAGASPMPWDQPFVKSQALDEAMDSKTCPIVGIVPIAYPRCLANLGACLNAEGIGTVWHGLGDPGLDRLTTLYLSVGGRPLALKMAGGSDPLKLDEDGDPSHGIGDPRVAKQPGRRAATAWQVMAQSEGSDPLWRVQLRIHNDRHAVLTTHPDATEPSHRVAPWLGTSATADAHQRLQRATLTTMKKGQPNSILPVTLRVSCSP